MAWGQAISAIADGLFEPESRVGAGLQFTGNLLTMLQSERDARDARAADMASLSQRMAIARSQLNMAQRQAAIEEAMRNRVLEQTSNLGATLQSTLASLGPAYVPTADEINANYAGLRDQAFRDVDRTVDRVVSAGYAEDIARGRDGMPTLQRDIRRNNVERFADVYQQADQAAFDAALGRVGGVANTINAGRTNRLAEVEGVYGSQLRHEQAMLTNGAPNMMATAGNAWAGIGASTNAGARGATTLAETDRTNFFTGLPDQMRTIAGLPTTTSPAPTPPPPPADGFTSWSNPPLPPRRPW